MSKDIYKAVLAGFVAIVVVIIGFFIGIYCCTTAEADTTMGFEVIDRRFGVTWIVYDIETGVMYALSYGGYNAGTMTVMVNPDGTPRVYEGFSGK